MRCRACDTVWLVSGPSSASSVAALSDETAPRAAVQRRGAERERRDLFASRPVDDGVVRETMRPPPPHAPPHAATNGFAARNENSVLFKVSDVLGPASASGAARVKTPEPSPSFSPSSVAPQQSRGGKEDSGIIDLKALSSAPPAPANRPPAPMLFGASDAPPAFARDVSGSSSSYPAAGGAPRKGGALRTVGMIAAGFAVVAACGIGVALAFGAHNPPPKAAAAVVIPPPPPAPPPAVTAPAPEPTSTTTTTSASTDDSKDAKDAKGKKGGKRRGKGTGGGGGKAAAAGVITNKTPPPPPPKAVKPADPCGCHGDFNCILACTAGKK